MHYAFMGTPESDRLIKARKHAGFDTAAAAAEALDIKEPTYMGHENGSRGFKSKAEQYARRFGVSLEWLLTGRGPMERRPTQADLRSEDVAAGFDGRRDDPAGLPLVAWVNAGKFADVNSQLPPRRLKLDLVRDLGAGDFFATKVEGDSMDRVSPPGSIIIVDRNDKMLVSGKCYVFAVGGKTTFKMYMAGDPPYLAPHSTNPINPPIFIKRKADIEIVGRVKRTVLDL
jgi:phage repressor protein C with HTH and peptisase S24 domain